LTCLLLCLSLHAVLSVHLPTRRKTNLVMATSEGSTTQGGLQDSDKKTIIKVINAQRNQVASGNLTTLSNNGTGPTPIPPATNMEKVTWSEDLAALCVKLLAYSPHNLTLGYAKYVQPADHAFYTFVMDLYTGATQPPDPWIEDWTTDLINNFSPSAPWATFTPAFVTSYPANQTDPIVEYLSHLLTHNMNKFGCGLREWQDTPANNNTWYTTFTCIANVPTLKAGDQIYETGTSASKCKTKSKTNPSICTSI